MSDICGVVSLSGPNEEPLACGWRPHNVSAPHSWATLPTFTAGKTEREVRYQTALEIFAAADHANTWDGRDCNTVHEIARSALRGETQS